MLTQQLAMETTQAARPTLLVCLHMRLPLKHACCKLGWVRTDLNYGTDQVKVGLGVRCMANAKSCGHQLACMT